MKKLLLMAAAVIFSTGLAHADTHESGKDDFIKYCAGCHGLDGTGASTSAQAMTTDTPPADLTRLSLANGGHFPYLRIRQIIDGRVDKGKMRTHFSGDMPVWGNVFSAEGGKSAGGEIAGEAIAKMRILNIVDYLASIQIFHEIDAMPELKDKE